jgi:hypothetical protein
MTAFSDKAHIEREAWETCCLKKRPTGDEEPGPMGCVAFGVITTARSSPVVVYLRGMEPGEADFAKTKEYATVDAMLADGWIVD